MQEDAIRTLMAFLAAGKEILSARVLSVMTLVMTFSLFCWAAYWPNYERIGIALGFAVCVFLPVLGMDKRAVKGD